jgi:hypothetical protein
MKKIFFLFVFFFFIFSTPLYAYDDCPFGMVNDPYPGQCSNYIDSDNSGYCDHSEKLAQAQTESEVDSNETIKESDETDLITGQDLKTKTVSEIAELYSLNVSDFIRALSQEMNIPNIKPDSSFQLLHDNYGVEPSKVKDIASKLAEGMYVFSVQNNQNAKRVVKVGGKNYNFGIISSIAIMLYAISFIASKRKLISVVTHRKIWNILLGIHFFATAILGILLVLRISYGFVLPIPFNMLFWHVESGIVFSLIAVFHIAWHFPYFKAMIKRGK